MRLRNIKGSEEKIKISPYVIHKPWEHKGEWKKLFKNDNSIVVEIGMGKGKFLREQAINFPNINYIGIEKFSSVLIRALEKRQELEADNLFFLHLDAQEIENIFGKEEVDKIYLNFSDPWPKGRHIKRRLTSLNFLQKYKQILKKNGTLSFKTDNRELFDFSTEEVQKAGWRIDILTYDLHNSQFAGQIVEEKFLTEYEERFIKEEKPICFFLISQEKT